MKFVNSITHLRSTASTLKFIETILPDTDLGQVDTYLKDTLDVNSEVRFFDAESIPNKMFIEVEGESLVNLFPLEMLQEIIEECSEKNLTDEKIAKRILEYRNKDA